jgi:hypothetical protein
MSRIREILFGGAVVKRNVWHHDCSPLGRYLTATKHFQKAIPQFLSASFARWREAESFSPVGTTPSCKGLASLLILVQHLRPAIGVSVQSSGVGNQWCNCCCFRFI